MWCPGDLIKIRNSTSLFGGAITILKNMMEFVNGKDYIPYMKWTIKFHGLKPPSSDKNSDYNSG